MARSEDHPITAPAASRCILDRRLRRSFAGWRARFRGRQLLAQFDEHMLRDIGIDPARVWQETVKWFWQP